MGKPCFISDAPSCVEILSWQKEGRRYFAALNQQEQAPFIPMHDISITVPYQIKGAHLVATGETLKVEQTFEGSKILLPKLEVFLMFEIEQ